MPHSLPAQTVRSFRAAHISTAVTRTGTAKLAGAELVGVIQHCPSFLRSDTVDCRVGLLPLDEAPSAQLPVAPVAIVACAAAVCCILWRMCCRNWALLATLAAFRAAARAGFLLIHNSAFCSLNLMLLASCHLLQLQDKLSYLL
ncbi:TPA: hypothetical protein ACH3X1_006004 [Trebouxia sp. C0004]